jgi:predicted protein tyrosine phosphatase
MCPELKVWNQAGFESGNLGEFGFAISIQPKAAQGVVLRSDFAGERLDLYFDDVVEGPGAASRADIEELFAFGQKWLAVARSSPAKAALVVHCGAGISRSAAAALLLLSLYFGSYREAAAQLYRSHPNVSPNALVCRLIGQKLGASYGGDILAELGKGGRFR